MDASRNERGMSREERIEFGTSEAVTLTVRIRRVKAFNKGRAVEIAFHGGGCYCLWESGGKKREVSRSLHVVRCCSLRRHKLKKKPNRVKKTTLITNVTPTTNKRERKKESSVHVSCFNKNDLDHTALAFSRRRQLTEVSWYQKGFAELGLPFSSSQFLSPFV